MDQQIYQQLYNQYPYILTTQKKVIHYVSVILTNDEGKLWTAQRINKNKPLYGKQCCPGGKIEDNETLKEACKREVLEECNIEIWEINDKLKYLQTNVYEDNRDGYIDTIRIIHLFNWKTNLRPQLMEPKNHSKWTLKIIYELWQLSRIDSITEYIEQHVYKIGKRYDWMKNINQCMIKLPQKYTQIPIERKGKLNIVGPHTLIDKSIWELERKLEEIFVITIRPTQTPTRLIRQNDYRTYYSLHIKKCKTINLPWKQHWEYARSSRHTNVEYFDLSEYYQDYSGEEFWTQEIDKIDMQIIEELIEDYDNTGRQDIVIFKKLPMEIKRIMKLFDKVTKLEKFNEFPYEIKAQIIRHCSTSTIENILDMIGQKNQFDPRSFVRQQLIEIRNDLQEITMRLVPQYIAGRKINILDLIKLLNIEGPKKKAYLKEMFGKIIMPKYITKDQYITKNLQVPIKMENIKDKLFQRISEINFVLYHKVYKNYILSLEIHDLLNIKLKGIYEA